MPKTNKPITYEERFTEILFLICKKRPPKALVKSWLANKDTPDNADLQDWVGNTDCPWWLQNIGAIDAATIAASTPIEGPVPEIDYTDPTE